MVGRQLGRSVTPSSDGNDPGSIGPGTLNVERGVADNHHFLRSKSFLQQCLGSSCRHCGEPVSVWIIRSEGANAKELPEPGRGELGSRALLDIAREQAKGHSGNPGKLMKQAPDSREHKHMLTIPDLFSEEFDIAGEKNRAMLVNDRPGNAFSAQQRHHDLWVSFPVEVVRVDGTGPTIHFKQRPVHGPPAGPFCRDQSAIDIKEEKMVHREEAFEAKGEMARRRFTVRGNTSSTTSISELRVQRPRVKLTEPSISSGQQPIALST